MADSQIMQRLRRATLAIAPRQVQVKVTLGDPIAPTYDVSIRLGTTTHKMRTGWAGEGWPADVNRLLQVAPDLDAVAAHVASVGARELLDDRGISWFDESGAANVVLPSGLILQREGRPRPASSATTQAAWSNTTIAVAEAVLTKVPPRVNAIQSATELSRGAVAKALGQLERDGVLQRQVQRGPDSGRRLTSPDRLLDLYASAVARTAKSRPSVFLHRLWNDPLNALTDDLAPALEGAGVSWAATGAAASMLLAPSLTRFTVVELYVDQDLFDDVARLEQVLDARRVERGQRIEVHPSPAPLTTAAGETVDGVRCAPTVRVYADLIAKGGRNVDAAHHLKELRIDD